MRCLILLLAREALKLEFKLPLPLLLELFEHLQPLCRLLVYLILLLPLSLLLFFIGLDNAPSIYYSSLMQVDVGVVSLLLFLRHPWEGSPLLVEMIYINASSHDIGVSCPMSVIVSWIRFTSQLLHVRWLLDGSVPLNLFEYFTIFPTSVSYNS